VLPFASSGPDASPDGCFLLPYSVLARLDSTVGCDAGDIHRRTAIVGALIWQHYLGAGDSALRQLTAAWLGDDLVPWDAPALVAHAQWRVDGGPKPGWFETASQTPAPIGAPDTPKLGLEDRVRYVQMVRESVAMATWPGRTGGRDRDAMLAICDLSLELQYPTIKPAVSGLILAERMNCGEKTARAALTALQASSHLKLVGVGLGPLANSYLLRFPTTTTVLMGAQLTEASRYRLLCTPEGSALSLSHPAFHRDALGRSVFRLLDRLTVGPTAGNKQWFTEAGVNERQFYKLLPKLNGTAYKEPLAVQSEGVWRLVDGLPAILDRIARDEGATDAIARRRVRTENKRNGYTAFLIRQTAEGNRYETRFDGTAVDKLTGEVMSSQEALKRSSAVGCDSFDDAA
jgi:hypothetical protein